MRSVPIVLLLAALAAPAAGQSGGKAPGVPPLTLPVASQGVADKGADPDDRMIITLDAKGCVHFKGAKTLKELSASLAYANDKYDLKMRSKGKRGTESLLGGGKVSRLYVLLRANKETPWQHVQWLLAILAEQGIYKVQFAVTRVADRAYTKQEAVRLGVEWVDRAQEPQPKAKLHAFLPVDRRPPPALEMRARIHILARQEIAAKWGPDGVAVSKPTVFKYRLGDRTVDSVEHVHKWIGGARKAAQGAPGTKLIGEIKAGYKVPFKYVVAVLNQFHAWGVERVDFWGTAVPGEKAHSWTTAIPGENVRERPYLTYPIKNYPTK